MCKGSSIAFILILMLIATASSAQEGRGFNQLEIHPDALHYLVVGDWGQGNKRQRQVAAQMAKVSEKVGVHFIISTGDNFYPSGVTSERDTLWKYLFEDVYDAPPLNVAWYPVLGNHDYGGNADAQILYSRRSERWKMPSRFYRRLIPLKEDTLSKVMFLFIDTTPLIPSSYGRGLAVAGQDTTSQLLWITKMLEDVLVNVRWTFVVGHHPIYTAGERRDNVETTEIRRILQPLFARGRVAGYLSGHEHNLQHLTGTNGLHQFVSGAGSEARLVKPWIRRHFARADTGFMLFSVLKSKTIVQVINRKGRVLYRYRILPSATTE
jgi:tartrate-resistant acid phosphatase type 5